MANKRVKTKTLSAGELERVIKAGMELRHACVAPLVRVGSEHHTIVREMAFYVGDALAKLNGKPIPLLERGSTGPAKPEPSGDRGKGEEGAP